MHGSDSSAKSALMLMVSQMRLSSFSDSRSLSGLGDDILQFALPTDLLSKDGDEVQIGSYFTLAYKDLPPRKLQTRCAGSSQPTRCETNTT